LCVVLCSNGYPEDYEKNIEISGLTNINLTKNDYLFHAGTFEKNQKTYVSGGRVLNFVSLGLSFLECKNNVYNRLKELNWTKGFYRKDIGHKVVE
jgi:phosphoribosylamine--glycine ligase